MRRENLLYKYLQMIFNQFAKYRKLTIKFNKKTVSNHEII